MTAKIPAGSHQAWTAIEREKQRDRFIRRVCFAAWSVTFGLLLLLGVVAGLSAAQMLRAVAAGVLPWMSVLGVVTPFIIVIGIVTLLIATLSTVGMFVRMRTVTLQEVQARLAALEEMLASRPDAS